MMLKKFFIFILSTLLLISMVTGCQGGGKEVANNENSGTESSEVTDVGDEKSKEERIKLVYFTNINVDTEGYDVNDNPYINYIREKTGIDIEIRSEGTGYNEKLSAVMASGDLPDYFLVSDRNKLALWVQQGLIQPLDEYIKNAPNLLENIDEVSWKLATFDDKIYAIPMQRYDKTPLLGFVKKDWVENLDINIEEVKTIDDWYKMLKAFVENDPDKNGQNDTVGYLAYAEDERKLHLFLDSFDAARTKYINGEVLPNYVQENYKEWLKFMNRLYKEKILDPEYVVNTKQQMWEKAISGKYGCWYHFWSLQEYTSMGGSREDLIAVAPPVREDGSQAGYLYNAPVRHYIAVTKDCKYPEKVVEIMDWAASDEGGTFVHAGLEGLDYDVVNGKIVIREDRKGKNWAWRFITLGIQKTKMDEHLKDILVQSWGELGVKHLEMSDALGFYDEILMFAPYFPELADYDLDSLKFEFRDKAIMGQIDIDKEWNNFVEKWRNSGGNEWIRLYTDWYENEYSKRQK